MENLLQAAWYYPYRPAKAPLMSLSRTNLLIAACLVEYPDEIPCLY